MTEITKKPLWVKCVKCNHIWIAAYMPLSMKELSNVFKRVHCPMCEDQSKSIAIAKQTDGVLEEVCSMIDQKFYIASLKHTRKDHEHITWWGKDYRGYTLVVGDVIGEYGLGDARLLNDGYDYLAVPVSVVKELCSPEPYFRPKNPIRFYDQPGPVVINSRAMWDRLIAAALAGVTSKPRPEVFRGKRRSFALAEVA